MTIISLKEIKKTDQFLLRNMANHYSKPKGFVGRSICFSVMGDNVRYGSIVAGSATLHLPNRNKYFNIDKTKLNNIINNIFFHIEPIDGKYPCYNFASKVLKLFRQKSFVSRKQKYLDTVIGWETLVELPRTGEIYKRDGWDLIGQTIGFTCKRIGGVESTDAWSGRRVWDRENLRPKLVFVKRI